MTVAARAVVCGIALTAATACSSGSRTADQPGGSAASCRVSPDSLAAATPRVQCFVRAFQTSCNTGTQCMINCAMARYTWRRVEVCWDWCYGHFGQLPPRSLHAHCPPPRKLDRNLLPPLIRCTGSGGRTREVSGIVLADSTDLVIARALVVNAGGSLTSRTDSSGSFFLTGLPSGQTFLWVRADGYVPRGIDLGSGDCSSYQVKLRLLYWPTDIDGL